jgi:hypothetical protein
VPAVAHARVVTVCDKAFLARLTAAGLPIDWRQDAVAHKSFVPFWDEELAEEAVALAAACRVGYSSQDWIQDRGGRWWFIDLNPGGQWLFLPPPVSDSITQAMAGWLDGSENE